MGNQPTRKRILSKRRPNMPYKSVGFVDTTSPSISRLGVIPGSDDALRQEKKAAFEKKRNEDERFARKRLLRKRLKRLRKLAREALARRKALANA